MDETKFSAPCFLVPIAPWLMVLLLVECCPLQGVYLYRIKQIFSTRAVQKCSKGFPCTRRHNKRFDHCLWIWVYGNTLFKIGYDWMLFLSIYLGVPTCHTGHAFLIPCRSPNDLALCRSQCRSRGPLNRQLLQMSVAPHTHAQRDWNRGSADGPYSQTWVMLPGFMMFSDVWGLIMVISWCLMMFYHVL